MTFLLILTMFDGTMNWQYAHSPQECLMRSQAVLDLPEYKSASCIQLKGKFSV